nr:hypothetical protein [Bacillus pumilus]
MIILLRMTVSLLVQDGSHSLIIFANALTLLPIGRMLGLSSSRFVIGL